MRLSLLRQPQNTKSYTTRPHMNMTGDIIHHQQVRLRNSYQRICLKGPHL